MVELNPVTGQNHIVEGNAEVVEWKDFLAKDPQFDYRGEDVPQNLGLPSKIARPGSRYPPPATGQITLLKAVVRCPDALRGSGVS